MSEVSVKVVACTYWTVTIWEVLWNLHNKLEDTILVGAHPNEYYSIPDWKQTKKKNIGKD